MFHAICAAQFALHNLGAKVLLFFDICKENRRFLVESRKSKVESRKSKVESRKTKKATPKGRYQGSPTGANVVHPVGRAVADLVLTLRQR